MTAAPIQAAEFAALLEACGPFEEQPEIAVGLSGGPDSVALTLLLKDWIAARGGRLQAYTLDHGLRAKSAQEAAEVALLCARQGIAHRSLQWRGGKPKTGVQAAARTARLAYLEAACRADAILHLCLGQHADDQAETFLLRLESGSGPLGLAGMSRVRHRPRLRILRPLLGVPKARLIATLRARGVSWFEDPSNRSAAHRRSQLRSLLAGLQDAGVPAERFTAAAASFGAARRALEGEVERLCAESMTVYASGYAWLDPGPLRRAPREVACQALAALLRSISGADYPPRGARLESLLARVLDGLDSGATLAGCRILPRKQGLLVCREASAIASCPIEAGREVLWDGRFRIGYHGPPLPETWLGPLTAEGWRAAAQAAPSLRDVAIPGVVRPSLPALRAGSELLALPSLGWFRRDLRPDPPVSCSFTPKNPLTGAPFTVA